MLYYIYICEMKSQLPRSVCRNSLYINTPGSGKLEQDNGFFKEQKIKITRKVMNNIVAVNAYLSILRIRKWRFRL